MNERAREILSFIRAFTREKGYPPTIREIGKAFQITSTNGVRYYLNVLQKEGRLQRRSRISRGTTTAVEAIPVLGRVAAGAPTLAEQNFEGSLELGRLFGDPHGLFALKVRGNSMLEAGILSGDYVIVKHQEHADPGDVIVALVDGEATVKYYRPRGDHIELEPANQEFTPIVVEQGNEFRVLGIVKGVMRAM